MTTLVTTASGVKSPWSSTTTTLPGKSDARAAEREGRSIHTSTQVADSPLASASAGVSSIGNGPHDRAGGQAPITRVAGLEKWEGLILEVDDELMTAELTPLDRTGPCMVADFQTQLLGEDAKVAAPGDVFYLTVRTVRGDSGYPTRTEQLRLRRLGVWTDEDVARLRQQAASRMGKIEELFG